MSQCGFGGKYCTVCLCSNMASSGTDFRCTKCDRKICDESYPCTLRNRHMYVSGISDCVQKTDEGKKCALVCSCGECVGEFIAYRKGLKYCLDLQKVQRCSVRSDEHSNAEGACPSQMTATSQTELGASTLSRKIDHDGNKPVTNSTVCGEEVRKEDEITQLKQTVAALEKMVKSMQQHNVEKFKDLCGVLLSQKLEIQRLQEIIWALHPNMNLDPAFTVDNKGTLFASNSTTSFGDLNVDED